MYNKIGPLHFYKFSSITLKWYMFERQRLLKIWPAIILVNVTTFYSLDSIAESDTATTIEEEALLGTGCPFLPWLSPVQSLGPDHV